jgi:hypothetical protein
MSGSKHASQCVQRAVKGCHHIIIWECNCDNNSALHVDFILAPADVDKTPRQCAFATHDLMFSLLLFKDSVQCVVSGYFTLGCHA